MDPIVLTAAHWVYAAFVVLVFLSIATKIDTAVVAIVGMFILGWIVKGSPIAGLQSIFNGITRAGIVLIEVVAIISIIVGMAKALEPMGVMVLMVRPFKKLFKTPAITWWVTGILMFAFSMFLWPSPSAALIGGLLLPAGLAVGVPAITMAMSMNLFGHGVQLSQDLLIQAAPNLTASTAGVPVNEIISASMPLNIVASIVCITIAWFFYARKDIKNFEATTKKYPSTYIQSEEFRDTESRVFSTPAKVAAITIPVVLVLDALALIFLKIRGGDATAVLGGTSIVLMSIFLIWEYGRGGIEKITAGVQEGFKFGMHCFAPVFLVAGFYLMGVEGYAQQILGDKAPNIVNDLIMSINNAVPMTKYVVAPLHMLLSALTGLDGSGFNDLPLMGGLAAAWGVAIGIKVPYLAALGQITMIWIGAGCVVPWSLIAVSAITGTSAMDVGRRNFIPVMSGLIAATILCIFLM